MKKCFNPTMVGPKRKLASLSKSKVEDQETNLGEEIHIGEEDGDETDSSVYSDLEEGEKFRITSFFVQQQQLALAK